MRNAPRPLLERLLNTPDLPQIVPRLHPEVLHRVIQTCGLEDCAEFVALATPQQLTRVLDIDIWRLRSAGADEAFDAERFGVWIVVLMEAGAAVAAEKLGGLDLELAVAGFTRHVAVFEAAAISSYTTLDGELVAGRSLNDPSCEVGGYAIAARRTSAWDAIVDLLVYLEAAQPSYFRRLMRGCVRLSHGAREADGFHDLLGDEAQQLFDVACDREARRERQGYLTAAQAHAFLRAARDLQRDADPPPRSPIAQAHFRATAAPPDGDAVSGADHPSLQADAGAPPEIEPAAMADVLDLLRDAGVLTTAPTALLGTGDGSATRLARVQVHVESHPIAVEELAWLANTLMAGASIQGRAFTPQEAADAAAATCNLGLEQWPPRWPKPELLTAFQIGWTVLHRDVCLFAASRLVGTLADLHCADRDIQLRLNGLRRDLVHHLRDAAPWRARNALDVIVMLDAPAWAALLGLIDECPVRHAALDAARRRLRSINPGEFQFFADSGEIAAAREFLASLPDVLTR